MKEIFPSGVTAKFKNMNKKKLLLILFASILLITAIVSMIACVASRKNSTAKNEYHQAAHAIIKSSCSATLYPDLCFSTISTLPNAAISKVRNTRDVIGLSLNVTKESVTKAYLKINRISSGLKKLTPREKIAFGDCFELLNQTIVQINKVARKLHSYPSLKKSIAEHAEEFKILLSAALTNQETCIDGFSSYEVDKKVRQLFLADERYVYRLCSNALALIKHMTDTDMVNSKEEQHSSSSDRKLEEDNGIEWPKWMSTKDRRLLQARSLTPHVIVAADGSGNYKTVTEAVNAAPSRSTSRYIIKIKAGVYRETLEVPNSKTNIMFFGDGSSKTIITYNKNVVDGSTTFNSATVAAVGDGFLARDLTFQNSAGPSKHQAVALRVGSDKSAFYRCSFIAFQDTLYVHTLRQFYVKCVIIGTIDFIFGNGAVVIQDSNIHARRPNPKQKNMLTAQGRTDPNENTGIVIQNCRIGATKDLEEVKSSFPTYLGRPWKLYSRTIVMQTYISDIIHPAGWYEWDGNFALDTLTYREYQNTGEGANTANRVNWKGFKVMTSASEARPYTAENFIAGSSWLPSTGFPYSLGL
ncbi:hypothetical protein JCGZ_07555 [Jatropha curcas]|uniref:Pectinesterase n=1 Tax=Jatropha curcas TaxID=180498 RepID=A0A067KQ80_JATCU|nr:pectinesterase [Jatropha curcas]KDP33984.1 hypothetical protein JCGZ_07555 [Jatropha curcas]